MKRIYYNFETIRIYLTMKVMTNFCRTLNLIFQLPQISYVYIQVVHRTFKKKIITSVYGNKNVCMVVDMRLFQHFCSDNT